MSKVIVIDVSSVDDQIASDTANVRAGDADTKVDEQPQATQQPERNGSFKFSTTTYCGMCKKILAEDFIGQCSDCSHKYDTTTVAADDKEIENTNCVVVAAQETKVIIEVSTTKDVIVSSSGNGGKKTKEIDNSTNLQLIIQECHSMHQPPSPSKSATNERTCRICLDNIDQGDLIAPCKCSGSTKYAHESCLLKWFFKSSKKSCEVCLGNVNVKPIGFKPFQEWRLPESGCDFIVYLFGLYFLIMVIFTGMITWIATQGCISPVCVTLYTVCAVAVFYFFYCCGCVEYSRKYWKTLLSVNKVWRIYGRADSLKNFKHNVKRGGCGGESQTPNSLPVNRLEIKPYVIEVSATTTQLKEIGNNNNKKTMGIHNLALEVNESHE